MPQTSPTLTATSQPARSASSRKNTRTFCRRHRSRILRIRLAHADAERVGLGGASNGAAVVVREHDHRHAGELRVEHALTGALAVWGEAIAIRMPGTAVLRIVADGETGELESATILGQFGEVPEDFAEPVSGG
jgi:hypothetical protein